MLQSSPGTSEMNTNQLRTSTVYTTHPEQFRIVAAKGSGLRSCKIACLELRSHVDELSLV